MKAIFKGGKTDGDFTISREYYVEEVIGNGVTLFDDNDLKENSIEWLRKNRQPWFEDKNLFTIK